MRQLIRRTAPKDTGGTTANISAVRVGEIQNMAPTVGQIINQVDGNSC